MLFDIDGTLLDTKGAGRRAMERVAAAQFGSGFSFEAVSFGGNLDPLIFAEAAAANGMSAEQAEAAHEGFHAAYVPALIEEMQSAEADRAAEACVGVQDCLAECRDWVRDGRATLGCLTGNYALAGPAKLEHVGIEVSQFTVTAWGDEADTRPGLVELAMRRHSKARGRAVRGNAVVVIGDTVRDVDCAKAHGCKCFAVCTGAGTRAQLEAAGADAVVDDLRELDALRAWVLGGVELG